MNLEMEKEQLSHAVEINALVAKLLQSHDVWNKRLWVSNIISWAVIAALILCLSYQAANMDKAVAEAINEAQETLNEAMIQALNTVADMEVVSETTTTTIEGDSATYNEVAGDILNDSAQKVVGE